MRTGDSLVTIDSPTGDRHSSPRVWKKKAPTSHIIEALPAAFCSSTAPIMHTKPMPRAIRPKANLTGELGSRLSMRVHRPASSGESRMMNSGLSDWNQAAGTSKPISMRSV